jgi:hypothetical protein
MHPYHHALSSAKKFGGKPEDYLDIHHWFDASKEFYANFRHRALRHHAQGIFECERVFGKTLTNSDGRTLPVRYVGEQHVNEDIGFIPSLQDWLSTMTAEPWMHRVPQHTDAEIAQQSTGRVVSKKKIKLTQ